ncbi:MAG: hypothetical protein U0736_16450 [Gemmataceae bacterium]
MTVSGQPAGHVRVALHPLGNGAAHGLRPVATTQADGSFRLTTYVAGDGAPPGEYAVTLIWPDESLPIDECVELVHDRLKGRYSDPATTPLRITIRPEPTFVPLRAAVGGGGWALPRSRGAARE